MDNKKISPDILKNVSVLSLERKRTIFVESNKFDETKNFLDKNRFRYTPYSFTNFFCLNADFDDINILSCQNDVEYIFPNSEVKIEKSAAKTLALQNLTENKYFGQGETICFIDTGIYAHFDFIFPHSRIIKFIDLINKDNIPYDDNGHGSFVAGVACGSGVFKAENIGIAPQADIIVIKALNENGSSNSNVILDAMQWVYENAKTYNISVVCMSFGADVINNSDPLSSGAEALWKRGLIVVAAAGNSGPEKETIKSPGNNPYIITVGALNEESMKIADFSSRGPTIFGTKPDLVTSGVNLISCNNTSPPYTNMSGTSVATPIIAGVCAIIKSKWPSMTNDEIKKFLLSNCIKITGDKNVEGAGYLSFSNLKQ